MHGHSHEYVTNILSQFLGPVMAALDDPDVEEVMVNSPEQIWVEKAGVVSKLDCKIPKESIYGAISMLGRKEGKDVKENSEDAILDTELGDYRVAAALEPTSLNGHSMCIRRHSSQDIPLEEFPVADKENCNDMGQPDPSEDMCAWLTWAVAKKKTILVSGGTSTGKTTFMRSLMRRGIHESERVICIEDVPELNPHVPNNVCFRVNEQKNVFTRTLVRLALRYRPDRIIVGEVRGAEAFDLMQAINTGHDGSLASIHANSSRGALSRLEALVLTANTGWPLDAIRVEIASSIDYVVQMSRSNKKRVISEIIELQDYEQGSGYRTHKIV